MFSSQLSTGSKSAEQASAVLGRAAVDELRSRRILLPLITVIEQLCATVLPLAEPATFRSLTAPLTRTTAAPLMPACRSETAAQPVASSGFGRIRSPRGGSELGRLC